MGATLFLLLLMYLGVYLYQGRVGQFEKDFLVEKTAPGMGGDRLVPVGDPGVCGGRRRGPGVRGSVRGLLPPFPTASSRPTNSPTSPRCSLT